MRVLDVCTGMGLLGKAFADSGFQVVPGCEIDPVMRHLHGQLHPGTTHLQNDIHRLALRAGDWHGVIGGPPCQSLSKLRAMRQPKFALLTSEVQRLLDEARPDWWIFENVLPLELRDSASSPVNAMHFAQPHQSRARWFTHSRNIKPPVPAYYGTVDDLNAYPAVAGKLYGPKRGSWLQGMPALAHLQSKTCSDLQMGLANAVPYPVGLAWARQAMQYEVSKENHHERV